MGQSDVEKLNGLKFDLETLKKLPQNNRSIS